MVMNVEELLVAPSLSTHSSSLASLDVAEDDLPVPLAGPVVRVLVEALALFGELTPPMLRHYASHV